MIEDDDLSEVIAEFVVECREGLDALDQALVALEQDPSDAGNLGFVFRIIHSIKGAAGFLGFSRLESVTHAAENLLVQLRGGMLTLTPESTTTLLSVVDVVRDMVSSIDQHATDGNGDYRALVATIDALVASSVAEVTALPHDRRSTDSRRTSTATRASDAEVHPLPSEPASRDSSTGVERRSRIRVRKGDRSSTHSSAVRIDVGLLDRIAQLVEELVLAHEGLAQLSVNGSASALAKMTERIGLISAELQSTVRRTRMEPIGHVWQKFPRIVRDLGAACGKQVHIEMEGTETELDKTIIEVLNDPLTHLVRNAVDHGIETPEVRLAAGKPAIGTLKLRASHDGGYVHIEISDDGGGLDMGKIRAEAIASGLISHDQSGRLSKRRAAALIFLPGFSTAGGVTRISGRGVGLDVVKTNIEGIGGAIESHSVHGRGTTFRITIPLPQPIDRRAATTERNVASLKVAG
jgi:two-component system, chemotaxis family, sensor kinase CheA